MFSCFIDVSLLNRNLVNIIEVIELSQSLCLIFGAFVIVIVVVVV